MSTPSSKSASNGAARFIRIMIVGAVMGVAGYFVGKALADATGGGGLDLAWSDVLAAIVALGLFVGALAVLITSLDPVKLGKMYGLEGASTPVEVRQARGQSLLIGFSGLLMILPFVLERLGAPAGPALAGVVVLLVGHTAMNIRAYLQLDELYRRAVQEQVMATFFLGQGLLFIWAVGERLVGLPALSAWDVYVLLMTFYLAASTVVSVRRGLA
jgi:hypothetical protein